MSERTFSDVAPRLVVALVLLLGLVVSGAAPSGAVAPPSDPSATASSAAPAVQRSRAEAPEPVTTTSVLPAHCLEPGDTIPSRPGRCVLTDYGRQRPTVVVWGDSHAWQQLPALRAQAERTRTNLVAFVMGACPPMDLRKRGYRGACAQQATPALAYVTTASIRGGSVKVVLGAFWELYRGYHRAAEAGYSPTDPYEQFLLERAAMFDTGGARLFGTLAKRGIATAAIAQAPWIGSNVAPCRAGEDPYVCNLPRTEAIPAEAATAAWVKRQLARIRVSGYIDPTRFLCSLQICRARLDGEPVFLDDLHLDPAITGAFAPEYRDLFA